MFIYYCLSAACINYVLTESYLFEKYRNYIVSNKWPILSYSLTCYMCTGIQIGLIIGLIMQQNLLLGLAIGYLSCIIIDIKNILEGIYLLIEIKQSRLMQSNYTDAANIEE